MFVYSLYCFFNAPNLYFWISRVQVFRIRPETVPSPTRLCRRSKSIAPKVTTVASRSTLRCTFSTWRRERCWPIWPPPRPGLLSTWAPLRRLNREQRPAWALKKTPRLTAGNRDLRPTTWSQSMKLLRPTTTTKRPGGTAMAAQGPASSLAVSPSSRRWARYCRWRPWTLTASANRFSSRPLSRLLSDCYRPRCKLPVPRAVEASPISRWPQPWASWLASLPPASLWWPPL